MKKKTMLQEGDFFKKYHNLFLGKDLPMTQTAMCWGIECGSGWYDILDELCGKIQAHCEENGYDDVMFTQIKEKYSTLRVYVNFGSDVIYAYIDEAEEKSSHVCEVCGSKRGKIYDDHGWLSVRCKKCKTKQDAYTAERLSKLTEK
jgi:hypothetical protein